MSAASPFGDLSRGGSNDVALIADDRQLTFAELGQLGGNFIAALAASGVRRGDRVALRGSSRAETVVALLAMAQAGVVAVLVHPRLTASEAAGLIDDAEVARALDDAAVDALLRDGVKRPWPALPAPVLGDPLAMIYTSGTSGRAKAAVLTHGSFAHSAEANWRHLGRRADDRWVASLPLAHVGGLSVLTRCLAAGRPVALLPRFDAAAVLAAVRAGGTIVSVVPTMLRALLEVDRDNALAGARA
ncbi:MAG: menE, partial [Myxococcaceae bacterium]|nr:menE [Myxococcaceae bacterium]